MNVGDIITKFFKYFLTGGIAALVDVFLFALLNGFGASVLLASAVSFCIAACVNFSLTSTIVFGQRGTLRRFSYFFAFAVVGFAINVGVTTAASLLLAIPHVADKLLGIAIAFVANFVLNLTIVFRTAPESAASIRKDAVDWRKITEADYSERPRSVRKGLL
jgi:putative flippase GtrA